MLKLAHLVNPVVVGPESDLYIAQPITFAAMRTAQACAQDRAEVELLTAQFAEDAPAVPDGFRPTPFLERSVLDCGAFQVSRKLPLIADLLDRLYAASPDADYLLYTNVDIALMPHFYRFVASAIEHGHDAFVINRRTLPPGNFTVDQLPWLYAQIGQSHPGFDCFVFRREVYPRYLLGNVCVGLPPIGKCLSLNLIYHATHFSEFADLHLTFHIGDERIWKQPQNKAGWAYNRQEFLAICRQYDVFRKPLNSEFIRRHVLPLNPDRRPPSWRRRLRRIATRIKRRLT